MNSTIVNLTSMLATVAECVIRLLDADPTAEASITDVDEELARLRASTARLADLQERLDHAVPRGG